MQKSSRQPLVRALDAAGCVALCVAAAALAASFTATGAAAGTLGLFTLALKSTIAAFAIARIIDIVAVVRNSPRRASGARVAVPPASATVAVTPDDDIRRAA